MLNWWLGRSAEDAPRDGDIQEPPETPAPVFAARAIKSALFGTPGFHEDDEPETPSSGASTKLVGTREAATMSVVSPMKPQGILLTPGTATARRKTVSFGEEVVDNEDKSTIGKSGLYSGCPGKFPSPLTPRVEDKQKSIRRTTLTRTLEAARNEKPKKSSSAKAANVPATETSAGMNAIANAEAGKIGQSLAGRDDEFDGDMTLDLNEPHSQSGRYWKSEYEKYHEEAMAEMRKLVKYKQLAKSYAKKKDSEAIDLGDKLREEQQKVANMETKVAELVAQIANGRLGGVENGSPDLMKNLARQTALAIKYKDQVDQFQRALQEHDADLVQRQKVDSEKHSSATESAIGPEVHEKHKIINNQLEEMDFLRQEMHRLRLNLQAAERKVIKLQDENARLLKDLATMNDVLEKSEKRRQSAEIQSEENNKSFQSLQKNYDILKEKAKSQRREAEILLDKRHKQVAKLKAEVASLKEKREDSNLTDAEHDHLQKSGGSKNQLSQDKTKTSESKLAAADVDDLISFGSPCQTRKRPHEDLLDKPQTKEAHDTGITPIAECPNKKHQNVDGNGISLQPENGNLLHDKILDQDRSVWSSKTSDNGIATRPVTETPRNSKQRSAHTALSEIINNADPNSSPAQTGNQLTPGFQKRFSNLSLESPKFDLPSLEPSYEYGPTRIAGGRHYAASPRPSMFNIAVSPTKQTFEKPRASIKDTDIKRSSLASSRLSSMSSRGRATLPPDRAAAAKARLEQKNAEKKRVQTMGDQKENIR